MKHIITLIPGDGIGPEVVFSAKKVIEAAGASVEWEVCEAGKESFQKGIITGVPLDTIESIRRNKVALKGPLETPIGYGEKSANVTLRKLFDTYGNIRPVKSFPGIHGPYEHYNIDMMIVRENVEDLYTGVEHMQTPTTAQALKLISHEGCERIIRLAFALAEADGRTKVTCATKANILKMTEGLMKRVFEDVAKEYPNIKSEHMIVDNCAHQMVMNPEQFDVLVMTNMNGDILSDLGSALVGGLGIAPGANYGGNVAIFEAVHGSAPDIAGQNLANPTALIISAIMMLRYLEEAEVADRIENALYVTLANGRHLTGDISRSVEVGTTTEFTDAVMNNLGKKHPDWIKREYRSFNLRPPKRTETGIYQQTVGIDMFIDSTQHLQNIGLTIEKLLVNSAFRLKMIANRGMQVYPDIGGITSNMSSHYQCRIISRNEKAISEFELVKLIQLIGEQFTWVHIERLQKIGNNSAYTQLQGEI